MDNYFETEGVSHSMIEDYLWSPQYYHHRHVLRDLPPEKSTDEMVIGSAAHCLVLEPSTWESRFLVIPKIDRRTKEGKTLYAKAMLSAKGRLVIDHSLCTIAEGAAAAVLRDPVAGPYLAADGICETPIFWHCATTGLQRKGKPDKVILMDNDPVVIELKTSSEPKPRIFTRQFYDFGYHRQLAGYRQGILCSRLVDCRAVTIAVRNKSPHDVYVYRIGRTWLQAGDRENAEALLDIANDLATGDWRADRQKHETELEAPYYVREGL